MQKGDICQEVCPFNRPPDRSNNPTLVETAEPAFQPREITISSTVEDILLLTEEQFRDEFKGSAVKRAKWKGLKRNASAVLQQQNEQ